MTRKYGPSAQKSVESAMEEFKKGALKSGKSRMVVTNSRQAVAIGLSIARKKGAKVPKIKTSRTKVSRRKAK